MQFNSVLVISLLGCFLCSTLASTGDKELHEHCVVYTECRQYAYICGQNKTCQCVPDFYRPNKYNDKCVGIIGEKCMYDEHCIEGAFCKEQRICECKKNLVPSEDNTECSNSSRTSWSKFTILPVLLYLKLYFWVG